MKKLISWAINHPDRAISLATLFLTGLLSIWGILLTLKSNNLNSNMLELNRKMLSLQTAQTEQAKIQTALSKEQLKLSKKQDTTSITIDSFNVLLRKIDATIGISTKQSKILTSQLSISQQEQKISNNNNHLLYASDESRFFIAVQNLKLLIVQPHKHSYILADWDSSEITIFLNEATLILKSQLENKFLLSNKCILIDWIDALHIIYDLQFIINTHPVDNYNKTEYYSKSEIDENNVIIKKQWRKCFVNIMDLSQNIGGFMRYYEYGSGIYKLKTQKLSCEDYIKMKEFKKKIEGGRN